MLAVLSYCLPEDSRFLPHSFVQPPSLRYGVPSMRRTAEGSHPYLTPILSNLFDSDTSPTLQSFQLFSFSAFQLFSFFENHSLASHRGVGPYGPASSP